MTETTNERFEFEGEPPTEEIDVPLNFLNSDLTGDSLDVKRIEVAEKDKERKERRYFSAFKLIVGCLIFLGCIYMIDVIVSAILKHDLTTITTDIIEIIKTLLFTLSGYLFARKENGD